MELFSIVFVALFVWAVMAVFGNASAQNSCATSLGCIAVICALFGLVLFGILPITLAICMFFSAF